MAEDLMSLFGPDEPPTASHSRHKKEKVKMKQEDLTVPDKPIQASEMDNLLGLFDPSLEDETTSDIDDCLFSCYTTKSKHKSPVAGGNNTAHDHNNNSSDSASKPLLNNAAPSTARRKPSSVNMLDRYNDWATKKLAEPCRISNNNNAKTAKITNITNATNNRNVNSNSNHNISTENSNNNCLNLSSNTQFITSNDRRNNTKCNQTKKTKRKLNKNINNKILSRSRTISDVSSPNCVSLVSNDGDEESCNNTCTTASTYQFATKDICSSSDEYSDTKDKISADGPEDDSLPDQMPSEPQEGNIEYKLKLLNPNQERFKRLVSQMQWRLREGLGEAIYEIGVEDSGLMLGLAPDEMAMSMDTLRRMARQLGASLTVIREQKVANGKMAEVLVRKVPDDQYSIELRIAVLGSSDVGKSTLLGVLTRGELDNGRGCARLNVFRHRHEVYSGKTSSISIQTMGFDSHGNVVDGTCTRSRDYDDEDICSQSSKIVNFIDLAGDQRYLHTTAFGLSGYCPHYAMLVVSAFCGLSPMAAEHLSLARAVELPLLLVVTKTDLATPLQLQHTLHSLRLALTAPPQKKVPLVVSSEDDAITCASAHESGAAIVPIFLVSSVSGQGLHLLKKFLFVLPPKMTLKEKEKSEQEVAQFQVDEVFHVDERVVVGGLLTAGVIPHGAQLMLGPFDDCSFRCVEVSSIHRNKVPCRVVCAGQSASLSLAGDLVTPVRKGMKLLSPETKPTAAYYFQARVRMVSGESGVGRGSELTAHIGNVRQTVVVAGLLGSDKIRASDDQPCSMLLRFLRQPEFVSIGARLLLRQGNTQVVGQLQQVFGEPPNTVLKAR